MSVRVRACGRWAVSVGARTSHRRGLMWSSSPLLIRSRKDCHWPAVSTRYGLRWSAFSRSPMRPPTNGRSVDLVGSAVVVSESHVPRSVHAIVDLDGCQPPEGCAWAAGRRQSATRRSPRAPRPGRPKSGVTGQSQRAEPGRRRVRLHRSKHRRPWNGKVDSQAGGRPWADGRRGRWHRERRSSGSTGPLRRSGRCGTRAACFAPRRVLVVVAIESGATFGAVLAPVLAAGLPATKLEMRNTVQAQDAVIEQAINLARDGAALAQEVGLEAESLVVSDDVSVASTLLRVADEQDASVVVVGAHRRGALGAAPGQHGEGRGQAGPAASAGSARSRYRRGTRLSDGGPRSGSRVDRLRSALRVGQPPAA